MLRERVFQLSLAVLLLAAACVTAPPRVVAAAPGTVPGMQPVLVEASPAPGAVLGDTPEAVALTFDRALSNRGTRLTVTNQDGERVSEGEGDVDPSNRFSLSTPLTALPEGRYRVAYQATGLGGSTFAAGAYEFSIDLPEPRLALLHPVNGQAFRQPDIPIEMEVHFFDFGLYNNRVHVYLDGDKVAEVRGTSYTLEGVEPGVHELRTVLARFEGEELPETAQSVTVAVAQPGAELTGQELAAEASPDSGLQLSAWQWLGILLLVALLLGIGLWLGEAVSPPVAFPAAEEDEPDVS